MNGDVPSSYVGNRLGVYLSFLFHRTKSCTLPTFTIISPEQFMTSPAHGLFLRNSKNLQGRIIDHLNYPVRSDLNYWCCNTVKDALTK